MQRRISFRPNGVYLRGSKKRLLAMIATDTHSLCWYLSGDKRLSQRAHDEFVKAESGEEIILVPSIVLVEMFWLLERKGQYGLKSR